MNAGNVSIERVDVTIRADLLPGWTIERLWDVLVDVGNDPAMMQKHEDHVLIYTSKD